MRGNPDVDDPAVVSALSDYVKVKFQAEQPDEEPTKRVMEYFQAVGLPTYVLLSPIDARAGARGAAGYVKQAGVLWHASP